MPSCNLVYKCVLNKCFIIISKKSFMKFTCFSVSDKGIYWPLYLPTTVGLAGCRGTRVVVMVEAEMKKTTAVKVTLSIEGKTKLIHTDVLELYFANCRLRPFSWPWNQHCGSIIWGKFFTLPVDNLVPGEGEDLPKTVETPPWAPDSHSRSHSPVSQ